MKNNAKQEKTLIYPPFDEAILTPEEAELVVAKVAPLNEFHFYDYCIACGLAVYLPLQKRWKIHNVARNGKSYRYSQEVLRPMFPTYVFVKTREAELSKLFGSKVLIKYLRPVNQALFREEIRTVRIAEQVGFTQELEVHKEIPVGGRFQIQSGIWQGVIGWLTSKDNLCKWTIKLDFLDQMITATINPAEFKMIRLDE